MLKAAPNRFLVVSLALAVSTVVAPVTIEAATYTLYAWATNSTTDWINESYAQDAPQGDCNNAANYARNQVRTSAQYLEGTEFDIPYLLPNEVILGVFVDANGRYDSGTSGNRFGLRVRGTVPETTINTPTWSQADESCAWRFGGSGWDVTSLLPYWSVYDIAGLDVAVRRFDNNDPVNPSVARLNAIRIVVTTGFTECTLDRNTINFPLTEVGSGLDANFRITNTGVGVLNGSVTGCGPFSIPFGSTYLLGPGASQTVTVRFQPESTGSWTCVLGVGGGNAECSDVTVTGSAGQAACGVNTASLSFPPTLVGASSDLSFRVTNVASFGALTGSVVGCGPFSIVSGGTYNLAPGAFQNVTVRFSPSTSGPFSCTAAVGGAIDCSDVALSGSGVTEITSCTIRSSLDRAVIDFGEVELGTVAQATCRIRNTGTTLISEPLGVSCPAFRIVGDPVITVAPGMSTDVTIEYAPTTEDVPVGRLTFLCGEVLAFGAGVSTTDAGEGHTPRAVELQAPRPNPFNPQTRVAFTHTGGRVELFVSDARGRRVRTLLDAALPAGRYERTWDGYDDRERHVPSGIYLFHLRSGGKQRIAKAALVK